LNPDDDLDTRALKEAQDEVASESAIIKVVRGEVANVGFRTAARAKARLEAYEKVTGSYTKYIEAEALNLENGLYGENAYKELGVARLVAQWINVSEAFMKEVEPLLTQQEKEMRRGYLEQSFENLPEDVKTALLEEFNRRKEELLVWFVGKVQQAQAENNASTTEPEAEG